MGDRPSSSHACPFVWYELLTSDLAAAEAFYTSVVGWQMKDSGMPTRYVLASAGGQEVAGLMAIPPEAAADGARPAWQGYIGVPNCDSAVVRAQVGGARLCHVAMDIPNVGRFATMIDPQGAAFVVFQGATDVPVDPTPATAPGTVGWHELNTTDSATALDWYQQQFGWTPSEALDMGEMGMYRMFATGGSMAGGMMNRPPNMPVSAWTYYFNVEAIDAAVQRVEAAGGQVVFGPQEVPGGSWIINGVDPQGAMFALVAPKR